MTSARETIHRGAPLAPRSDALLSTSLAAKDAPAALAVVGDGIALDYRELAQRLAAITPERCFAPLGVGTDLVSVLAVLSRLEHRSPAFLEHLGWSASQRESLTERLRSEVPEKGDAFVLATSGTSGSPRLVVHSRASLVAAVTASEAHLGFPSAGDRWLLNLPLSHVGGLSIVLRCLAARRTLVLGDPKDAPGALLSRVERHGVTLISAVPTQLSRWLAEPHFSPPKTLRAVLVGGAPLSSSLRREAERRGLRVLATYGMTETASQIATELPGAAPGLQLLPGLEARADADTGHLLVRGPQLFARLLGEPAALTPDGFYRTNDRAHFDGASALVLEGRLDSVIVTGGEKVSPESLELRLRDALEDADLVAARGRGRCAAFPREICIVGVPDSVWGERVVLLAEYPEEEGGPEGELRAVRAELLASAIGRVCARYERPKEVLVVPELPRLGSDKLDRRATRECAARLLGVSPESA